jgi:hypothetical protein
MFGADATVWIFQNFETQWTNQVINIGHEQFCRESWHYDWFKYEPKTKQCCEDDVITAESEKLKDCWKLKSRKNREIIGLENRGFTRRIRPIELSMIFEESNQGYYMLIVFMTS